MKIGFYILLFSFLLPGLTARSVTWLTVANGNWNSRTTWSTGVIPPYSSSDTILIRDTVFFQDDIVLNYGALMRIDSAGGALCGHFNLTVGTDAWLNIYGVIDADTFFETGGHAECAYGGVFRIYYGLLTGGIFEVFSNGSCSVRLWQNCFETSATDTTTQEEQPPNAAVVDTLSNSFSVFPNPGEGNFSLQYTQVTESTFYFYNAVGQMIFSSPLENLAGQKSFNTENLPRGMYYWKVAAGNKVYGKGKASVMR